MRRLVLWPLAAVMLTGAALPAAAGAAARPDLSVTSFVPDTRAPVAGGSILIRATVRNSGRGTAKPSRLQFVLSRDKRVDGSDERLLSRQIKRLKPRKGARVLDVVALPDTLVVGRRHLFACADAGRRIKETDERNNCRRAALVVAPKPPPPPPPPPPPAPTPIPTPTPEPPDVTAPVVSMVTSPTADAAYSAGDRINVVVTFDEAVSVTGTPRLLLETGATDRLASYSSGSGTKSLVFAYTVQAGDFAPDLDYASASALTLNGGTIADSAGNAAELTLPAPGAAGSLAAAKSLTIDTSRANTTGVSTSNAAGAYRAGQPIAITVGFDEPVLVTGAPRLLLATGGGPRSASYKSGSGTSSLVFEYVVQAGDATEALDYASADALGLNGGSIRDRAGNDAVRTLALPGSSGSLAAARSIVLDTQSSTVSGVDSSAPAGPFKAGDVVSIQVAFSEPVSVTRSPLLLLETGEDDRAAAYAGGSGTDTLTFEYTVAAGDTTSDLDYRDAGSLILSGGTIVDRASNAAQLTLPVPGQAGSLAGARDIEIDTTAPAAAGAGTQSADGVYGAGDDLAITIAFSEPVFVSGSPELDLETGLTDRAASYTSGSGTPVLVFAYEVREGDATPDLDYLTAQALRTAGGSIRDAAGNDASLVLASPGAPGSLSRAGALVVDTRAPTVFSLGSPKVDGSYTQGELIPVTITFSEPVLVTGAPRLALETGRTDRFAHYVSGSGSNVLTFSYAVEPDDASPDLDHASAGALTLQGGTITDIGGHDARLRLPAPGEAGSLSAAKNLVVEDTSRPRVLSVGSPEPDGALPDGRYRAGAVIPIDVIFNEPVDVNGAPTLVLETGDADTQAVYLSGSGSQTLRFLYTVAAGDNSADLDYAGTGALIGAAILDPAANEADRALPAPGSAQSLGGSESLMIDTRAPTVLNVTSSRANGTYAPGTTVPVQITFSEPVLVGGKPALTLETGTVDREAPFTSGSSGSTLTFTYTAAAGDTTLDLDYVTAAALAAGEGASLTDGAGNPANLALPAPGATGSLGSNRDIAIDSRPPSILSVTTTAANGTYKIGDVIPISVTFSDPVRVGGSPRLTLATGVSPRQATYLSGSDSSVLLFNYTVEAGDVSPDLNYVSTSALSLNGGSIRDLPGNNAQLALPALASPSSLAGSAALVVDGIAPSVLSVGSDNANATYVKDQVITIKVRFSEVVNVTGTPVLALETGNTDRDATYSSGTGTDTLSFTYTVVENDASDDLDYRSATSLSGGTIADAVGNSAVLTLALPGQPGSLGAAKAIVVAG